MVPFYVRSKDIIGTTLRENQIHHWYHFT